MSKLPCLLTIALHVGVCPAVGIPLIVHGGRKVLELPERPKLVGAPTIVVGPGTVMLRGAF